jgi:hypothetical protein
MSEEGAMAIECCKDCKLQLYEIREPEKWFLAGVIGFYVLGSLTVVL